MMIKKTSFMLMLVLFSISENVFSQEQMYRTVKGDIALTITYKDTVIIAASNQLIAILDYETGKIIFRVQYETFHSGIDSIDNNFKFLTTQELHFEGALNIFINTQKRTPQKYNMTGMMTSIAFPFPAEGNGTVVCVPAIGDDFVPSCKLIATIECKLSQLHLTGIFKNAVNNMQIDLRQSLLEKDKVN
ncbi:MAG: hypothetical protein JJE25_04875 [Bacteroidia bacterium]|nr:hypothetical protein [Bacteroidia bacterium]